MKLTSEQVRRVINKALMYLGTPYEKPGFTCVDFARAVYREVGIELPVLGPMSPPKDFNITKDQLDEPPVGHLIFLKDKSTKKERNWTHVAILIPGKRCVHCARPPGKILISSLKEIFESCDFAPSLD